MIFAVRDLQVEEDQIDSGRQALVHAPVRVATGIEGRRNSRLAAERKEGLQEVGLHCRLAAGDGHATTGTLVERPVLDHLLQKLFWRPAPADQFQRAGGASVRADIAGRAAITVDPHAFRLQLQGVTRAGWHAALSPYAANVIPDKLRMRGEALWVLAPAATQGAALHENGRSDTGPILRAEALNVEDCPGHGIGCIPRRRCLPC